MNVYVLIDTSDGNEVVGAYSSADNAIEAINKLTAFYRQQELPLHHYIVEQYELDGQYIDTTMHPHEGDL
jgi:hypothetical protein